MRAAGFEPRGKLASEALPDALRDHNEPRLLFLHRCPTCDISRPGRLARHDWRCSRCLTAGRSGRLIIERQAPGSERGRG